MLRGSRSILFWATRTAQRVIRLAGGSSRNDWIDRRKSLNIDVNRIFCCLLQIQRARCPRLTPVAPVRRARCTPGLVMGPARSASGCRLVSRGLCHPSHRDPSAFPTHGHEATQSLWPPRPVAVTVLHSRLQPSRYHILPSDLHHSSEAHCQSQPPRNWNPLIGTRLCKSDGMT